VYWVICRTKSAVIEGLWQYSDILIIQRWKLETTVGSAWEPARTENQKLVTTVGSAWHSTRHELSEFYDCSWLCMGEYKTLSIRCWWLKLALHGRVQDMRIRSWWLQLALHGAIQELRIRSWWLQLALHGTVQEMRIRLLINCPPGVNSAITT
jgi:hypothetical protein